MVLIITIGACASLFAPLIVVYAAPVPFVTMCSMMTFSFACSCILPTESQEEEEELEEHLLEGWNRQDDDTTVKVKRNHLSHLGPIKKKKTNTSFALFAAKDGYLHAQVNATQISMIRGDTMLHHT